MIMHSKKVGARGFTLIELLVVIAIIGILSAVVLTSLNSARLKARDARRISDMKNMSLAFELFYDSCGRYPSALATTDTGGGACSGSTTLGDFLSTIPSDPTDTSHGYGYKSTDGTSYLLADQLEGGAGAVPSNTNASGGTATAPDGTTTLDCSAAGVYCITP